MPPSLMCVKCAVNFTCDKNGVTVVMPQDSVIEADLYECPKCGVQILSGFAQMYLSPKQAERAVVNARQRGYLVDLTGSGD